MLLSLTIVFICVQYGSSLPVGQSDRDRPTTDPKIYGIEPYQLEFQEPPHVSSSQSQYPHQNNGGGGVKYYPTTTGSGLGEYNPAQRHHHPYTHQHYHHPESAQRQRIVTQTQTDYDPFYFSARAVGRRNRRNSKFRDFDLSNHLLNEDVHFFRRQSKPNGNGGRFESGSSVESFRFVKDRLRLPVHDSSPYFPPLDATASSFHDHFVSPNSLDRRGHYPLGSNHVEFYDSNRHHQYIPNLFVPDQERYGREPIDGWSVQIGTQLKVHDDGREINPSQFYVRDEKPASTRRYPHRHEYI